MQQGTFANVSAALIDSLWPRASFPTNTNNSHTQYTMYTQWCKFFSIDIKSTGITCGYGQLAIKILEQTTYEFRVRWIDSPDEGVDFTGQPPPLPMVCSCKFFVAQHHPEELVVIIVSFSQLNGYDMVGR